MASNICHKRDHVQGPHAGVYEHSIPPKCAKIVSLQGSFLRPADHPEQARPENSETMRDIIDERSREYKLLVFYRETSPNWKTLREFLHGRLRVQYALVDLDHLPTVKQREISEVLVAETGTNELPQIFLQGEHYNWDKLWSENVSGELAMKFPLIFELQEVGRSHGKATHHEPQKQQTGASSQ